MVVVVVISAVVGLICLLAGLSVHSEREDSVEAIQEDMNTLLEAYRSHEDQA